MIPRIRLVQIKNYKSLASVSVELEPFTVFVGPNGSGKSNFIDALAFVQECLSESLELAVQRRGGGEIILSKAEAPIPVSFIPTDWNRRDQKERFGAAAEAASAVSFRIVMEIDEDATADYSLALTLLSWGGFFVSRERCVVVHGDNPPQEFEVKNGTFVHEIEGIQPVAFLDRLSLFAASATPVFRPVYEFLSSMRFYSIVPDMLRQPQEPDLGIYLKRDGSNAAAVLSNLKRYGSGEGQVWEILPGLLGQIAEGIVSVDKVAAGTKETLLFQQRWGGGETKNFYAISMSDGTLRALGVLLAIYQLARPSVVGIEEPEATVHPALRDMMTEVLVDAAGQRQILITTHSPELVDFKEIRDEQIRMVTLRNGHTVIAPLPESRREVIRQRLATPGELLRMGEIRPDDAEEAPESAEMDLFGPPLADASQMQ